MALHHALIRTHHITSRKKIAALKDAAKALNVSCLLRSGGSPGVMYVEGDEQGVKGWVATVQRLKYKDYQLAVRPDSIDTAMIDEGEALEAKGERLKLGNEVKEGEELGISPGSLEEVDSVKGFGEVMQRRGIWNWWRRGMGFSS